MSCVESSRSKEKWKERQPQQNNKQKQAEQIQRIGNAVLNSAKLWRKFIIKR